METSNVVENGILRRRDMFCEKCGNQVPAGTKFCKQCGARIEQENIIQNLNDSGKTSKQNEKKPNKNIKILLVILLLVLTVLTLNHYHVFSHLSRKTDLNEINKENIEKAVDESLESMEIERIDVNEYYEQNSDLLATIDVTKSENVMTEKEVEEFLKARGFDQFPVMFEYSMDGTYSEAQETTGTEEKHPIYQTCYVTDEEMWTIIIVDGTIVANPVSFNLESELPAQLVFAQTTVITGYDSVENKFYKIIPNESELIVYVIDKVDVDTLSQLTIEEIKNYAK